MAASTVDELSDFETAIEAAFKLLFTENGIESCVDSIDEPDTQRPRPRVEVYFAPGGETGHISANATYRRPDMWTGNLTLRVVSNTKPDEVGTSEHSAYRAKVRNLMAMSRTIFKSDADASDVAGYLPYHTVADLVLSGSNPSYEGQDGYYETTISYDLTFNIRPTAWPSE